MCWRINLGATWDAGRHAPGTANCLSRSTIRYLDKVHYYYQGIYVLIEKIKRDANRVAIAKLNPDETSGDDVTGGYILKIDKTTGTGGCRMVVALSSSGYA